MPTTFTLSFYGEEQVSRTLLRYQQGALDMRPAWERLARRFQRNERQQFASEGAYASGGWAPLSPAYAAWKARHYPGKPILERTGALKASLTERPFGIEVLETGFMVVGSHVDYGAYHQRGGGRLPRRRPVELPEAERREWVRIIQERIVRGDTAGGGF